ncbi:TPA: hypothetical protein ROX98_002242 [Bacillus pseudomycoides]|nr:hypothetical protein [Bacillus pseudomycoides]
MEEYIELYRSGKIKFNKERELLIEYLEKYVLNRDDLYFDDEMIQDCINFGEKWYFPLQPFQKFLIAFVFLFYKKNGRVFYRKFLWMLGRGGGKNGLISVIIHFLISELHGIPEYNISVVANSEEQAKTSPDEVKKTVRKRENETLRKAFKATETQITSKVTGSVLKYRTSNGDTKDGLRDGAEALEGVRRQWALNKTASDEANTALVKQAATISQTYEGIDFTELIQETNEISSELGISQEGAMGMADALLKVGFPPEQLDIIAEYGGQLTRAGFKAEEVQAIMEAGIETGTWNIDNLLDGLKEGRVKLNEFAQGADKALKEALDGSGIATEQIEQWGAAVAKGGSEGSQAMVEVAKAIDAIEDPVKKNQVGVKVLATMYEDQGQNITNTLIGASKKTIDFKKNQDQLNESVKKLDASPAVKMEKAFGDLKMALEPVLEVVANVIGTLAEWISKNPELAATLAVIATVIGVISGTLLALAPIIVTVASALGIGMAAAAGIVVIIPTIIAAIAALVIAIVKNWDSIKQKTIDIWNSIIEFLSNLWNGVVDIASEIWGKVVEVTTSVWNGIKDFFSELWAGIVELFTTTVNGIRDFFIQAWTTVSEFFMSIWNGIVAFLTPILQGIADFFSVIWNGISTVIQTVWNFITQYLQAIWTAILYFATPIFESVKQFIVDTWNTISSTTSAVWQAITDFLSSCWNGLVSFVTPIFESIKNFIISVWDTVSSTTSSVWNAIVSFLTGLWNGIVSTATSIFDGIKNVIVTVWNWISSTSSSIWDGISSLLSSVWDGIKSTASSIWEGLEETIMGPVRWVTGAVTSAFDGMKSGILSAWAGIKSGVKTTINFIIKMINKFIDGFNAPADALNKIPGVDAPKIPHVPMLEKGGHVLGDGHRGCL